MLFVALNTALSDFWQPDYRVPLSAAGAAMNMDEVPVYLCSIYFTTGQIVF